MVVHPALFAILMPRNSGSVIDETAHAVYKSGIAPFFRLRTVADIKVPRKELRKRIAATRGIVLRL